MPELKSSRQPVLTIVCQDAFVIVNSSHNNRMWRHALMTATTQLTVYNDAEVLSRLNWLDSYGQNRDVTNADLFNQLTRAQPNDLHLGWVQS